MTLLNGYYSATYLSNRVPLVKSMYSSHALVETDLEKNSKICRQMKFNVISYMAGLRT